MQAIKDAVHDYIELDELSRELLDTPEIQRLRRIRQLSTVSLVYPSANHTRFEHSLGVYHLASVAADHLDLASTDAQRVRAAALLNDIGHGPYGHQTEGVIERRLDRHHDEVGDLLTGEIADEAGCARKEVILDVPGEPSLPEAGTKVVVGGRALALASASSLVSGLDACACDGWRLGVYAPEARVESVETAARTVLGRD